MHEAVYDWMTQWIERKTLPPTAPRIVMASAEPGNAQAVIARDAFGIARGGIRLAHVEVPIATNTGENSGDQYCGIFGSHEPFQDSVLARLYPTHKAYVAAVARVTDANLKAGYITKDAAKFIKGEAERSSIGRR